MFDTTSIRRQAHAMHLLADDLHSYSRTISLTDIPTWHGPSADAFRSWLGTVSSAINLAALDVGRLESALNDHAIAVDQVKDTLTHPDRLVGSLVDGAKHAVEDTVGAALEAVLP